MVLTGGSAGGLSTFLHIDRLASRLPPTTFLVGKPVVGFFLDYKAEGYDDFNTYPSFMKYVFDMQNASGSLSKECQVLRDPKLYAFTASHNTPFRAPIPCRQPSCSVYPSFS